MRLFSQQRRASRRAPARLLSALLALLVLASALPAGVAGQSSSDPSLREVPARQKGGGKDGAQFVSGEALVRFRSEAEATAAESETAVVERGQGRHGMILGDETGGGPVVVRFRRFDGSGIVPGLRLASIATDDALTTLDTIAALNTRPDVEYAEPNYLRFLKVEPNDPFYVSNPNNSMYGLRKINAPAAWDTTRGSTSVVIGVIDEGIDITHPDLVPNIWTNPGDPTVDGVDNDGNGRVDDTNGWDFRHGDRTVYDGPAQDGEGTAIDFHGTHVAGTIGAKGNNGIGVAGVNWDVRLASIKVFDANGTSSAALLGAFNYARDLRVNRGINLRALNNSYGGPGSSQSELNAIRALADAGILFVVAAGNSGRDNFSFPDFPSNYDSPNIIAVASTDPNDQLSSFSNFSARLVSIGAPGGGNGSFILSTYPRESAGDTHGYIGAQGTSMAAPHVTGVAGLILAVNPSISLQHLRGSLAFTGDRIPSLSGNTTTGRRLNAQAAVAAALENDTTAPTISNLQITSQTGRAVTLTFTAPADGGGNSPNNPAADYDFFFVNGSNQRFALPSGVVPAAAGSQQSVVVNVPFRNTSGTIEMRAYDNRGNEGTASVPFNSPVNAGIDPYIVTQSAAQGLSTGGTALTPTDDDRYYNQPLPFPFPFFGQNRVAVTVSTNGALYFETVPTRDDGSADDARGTVAGLQGQAMIAGMWDDLRTDRPGGGIFVVQPDADRVIYRWQGVTFNTPLTGGQFRGENPINFEIELRRDGTIIFRYGTTGNTRLFPVVGISGGEPEAYVVTSHTSDVFLRDLTAAPTVTFSPRPASQDAVFQFNTSGFAVSEADPAGRATLTVTRGGNTQTAASVEVRTVDAGSNEGCANGAITIALARCDYSTTIETLNFAANETSKTFSVPLVNDGHAEQNETVQLELRQPSAGAQLGTPSTMTLTITSDDAANAPNPLDGTPGAPHTFFVRQQYLDFLSREPDDNGLQAWLNVLNGCPFALNRDKNNPSNVCDRNRVSESFFLSPEFALKGFYVFRFYPLSFNRLPDYDEIVVDMRRVTGTSAADTFARRAAFAEAWVTRPDFAPTMALDNTGFVNALMGRYNLQSVRTPNPSTPEDQNSKQTLTRADLVNLLAGGTSRGKIVRAIADSDEVNAAEFQRAFVAMQYYGYLRRTPDTDGFNAWLNVLRNDPSDSYTMVNGFASSPEYRLRFGKQ
jgi:subtilisin family serine protease